MSKAARAIIIEKDNILVMYRQKYGNNYYTLVGGEVDEGETTEDGLVREIHEETGLKITSCQLVYIEKHPDPYNEQYIYLCNVAPHNEVAIQEYSEESKMNKHQANIHTPMWASLSSFSKIPFRTPQIQDAILKAIKKGFPKEPINL